MQRLTPPHEEFQSTCPARGTTVNNYVGAYYQGISIHVPREGHDRLVRNLLTLCSEFQSTCPARGTTANMHNFFVQICARVTNIPLKGMPYLQKTYVSI